MSECLQVEIQKNTNPNIDFCITRISEKLFWSQVWQRATAILTQPFSSIRMFCGFKSRWTTFFEWIWFKPLKSIVITSSVRLFVYTYAGSWISSWSERCMYGMTKHTVFIISSTIRSSITFSCLTKFKNIASLDALSFAFCSLFGLSSRNPESGNLIATTFFAMLSKAAKTTPY